MNPFDVVIAAGKLGTQLPMIPGIDFAGVVVSDGDLNGQEVRRREKAQDPWRPARGSLPS